MILMNPLYNGWVRRRRSRSEMPRRRTGRGIRPSCGRWTKSTMSRAACVGASASTRPAPTTTNLAPQQTQLLGHRPSAIWPTRRLESRAAITTERRRIRPTISAVRSCCPRNASRPTSAALGLPRTSRGTTLAASNTSSTGSLRLRVWTRYSALRDLTFHSLETGRRTGALAGAPITELANL
jgi:hypothetical protein